MALNIKEKCIYAKHRCTLLHCNKSWDLFEEILNSFVGNHLLVEDVSTSLR